MCRSSMCAHGPRPLRCRLRVPAMLLDPAAANVLIVFELAAGGIEGIAQGHIGVFMSMIERMAVADYDLLVRHGDVDPDVVQSPLLPVLRRAFDADPAAQNVGTEPLQTRREFTDARAQRRRGGHLLEAHLHGKAHRLGPPEQHVNGLGRRPLGRRPQ